MSKNRQEIAKNILVYGGLALFGVAYNKGVEWLDERQVSHPYTSLLVVVGTGVTVTATIPLIGRRAAAAVLGGFVAAGLPMVAGSIERWIGRELKGQAVINASTEEKARPKRTAPAYSAPSFDRDWPRLGAN